MNYLNDKDLIMDINQEKIKLLIIEDDWISSNLLQKILSAYGPIQFEVEQANSLVAAFIKLDESEFDVVLLDLNLPDSKGLNSLKKISEKYIRLAIVVVTGTYCEETGIKAVACGAQEYLVKGKYDANGLIRAINYAIERKKAKDDLLDGDEKYREIAANIPGVIYQLKLRKDGTILFPSIKEEDYDILGIDIKKSNDDNGIVFGCMIAKDNEELKKVFSSDFKSGKKIVREFKIKLQNGQIKCFRGTFQPEIITEEEMLLNGIFFDITDRCLHEEALRDSEKNYKNFYNNAPIGLFRLSVFDGNIVECNNYIAKMFGYDNAEKFINIQNASENPFDSAILHAMLDYLKINSKIDNFEVQLKHRDGNFFWASISAHLQDKKFIDGVIIDITKRKSIEENLKKAQLELEIKNEELKAIDRIKSEFIVMVSHELRTPLTIVREGISQINDGVHGQISDDQKKFLSMALADIDHLSKLVNVHLDISKLNASLLDISE